MKRTLALIITLIVIASALLIYSLSPKSPEEKKPAAITPTKTIPAASSPQTILTFSPEYLDLTSTDSAVVDIEINTGENKVTGVQFEFGYDADAISDIRVSPGGFIPNSNILLNINDKKNGRLSYALVVPPALSPVTGKGKVATVYIRKNLLRKNTSQQTVLDLLPKSLVSALGVSGSVLKESNKVTITLGPVSQANLENSNNQTASGSPNINQ